MNLEIFKKNIFNVEQLESIDVRDATSYFAYKSNLIKCPIAKFVLSQLPKESYIIDTRVHMLKPSWYPCIPGWHYDEISRTEDKKLDFENNDYSKIHYLFILDFGTGSFTEFCEPNLETWPTDYTQLNEIINEQKPELIRTGNNIIYKFGNTDAHRGIPATGHGFRYFFRATLNSQRQARNEIRKQLNVYLDVNKGW